MTTFPVLYQLPSREGLAFLMGEGFDRGLTVPVAMTTKVEGGGNLRTRDVAPVSTSQQSRRAWIGWASYVGSLRGSASNTRRTQVQTDPDDEATASKASASNPRRAQLQTDPYDATASRGVPDLPSSLSKTHLGMDRLRRLSDGWAGEDSIAPTREAMADAQVFLAMAAAIDLPEPLISATDSGEVVFDWRMGGKKASVRFDGDGFFGYALFCDGKYRPGQQGADLADEDLPQELADYVRDMRQT